MDPENHVPTDAARDGPELTEVLCDIVTRRAAGEPVTRDTVIAEHPHLMPELGERLAQLDWVELAHRCATLRARSTPGSSDAGSDIRSSQAIDPSKWLPGYRVVREMRRGGQGVVYRAIQNGTRREVAIKILREGPFAGPRDRARLEREVHVLGALNHPHIVTIHECGEAMGCSYYVMDYVDGQSLDDYIENVRSQTGRSAEINDILLLFVKICEAVNAAHLRGIIHRDLKPANILIDAAGEPRILDFGLAKLTPDSSWDFSQPQFMSVTGQFIGSLPWASPEQAAGNPDRIDIRADVYSLGVMLYRLLTGEFPYAVTGPPRDVLNNIAHAEPAQPRSLCRRIPHDVETILVKCLAKEPDRRYQSAGEMARDIRRFLCDEPILARRASTLYQLRMFARRRRGAVAAITIVTVSLVVGAAGFAWQAAEATRERNDARLAERHAAREAEKARRIQSFLQDMLASVDPFVADPLEVKGRDVRVRDVLDRAATRVVELGGDPLVEAAVRRTIGDAYRSLGLFEQARPCLQEALAIYRRTPGSAELDVADSLWSLALLSQLQQKLEAAEVLYREALEIRRRRLGDHALVAACLANLAKIRALRGDLKEADILSEEADAMQGRVADHALFTKACTMCHRATVLKEKGAHREAEALYREALVRARSTYGENHAEVGAVLMKLGALIREQGRPAEAESLLRESLDINRKALEEHAFVAQCLSELALTRDNLGDHAEAALLLQEALDMNRRLLGEEHAAVAANLAALGRIHQNQHDYVAAEQHLRNALSLFQQRSGDRHWQTAESSCALGACLVAQGRYDEAEPLLLEGFEVLKGHPGLTCAMKRRVVEPIVALYEARNDIDQAALWRKSLPDSVQAPP